MAMATPSANHGVGSWSPKRLISGPSSVLSHSVGVLHRYAALLDGRELNAAKCLTASSAICWVHHFA